MKRACYLVVIAFLGLVGLKQRAHCQEQKKPPEGVSNNHASTDYRWDVSLDAFRMIAASQAHVTLRYAPIKGRGAFRATISTLSWFADKDASKMSSDSGYSATFDSRHEMQSFSTSFGIGYEWRRNLRVGQFFHGVDMEIDWHNNYKNTTGILPSSSLAVAVAPFCGYKYQISKRLSASVESNLYINHRWSKGKSLDGEVTSKSHRYGFALSPISKLNFTFHF